MKHVNGPSSRLLFRFHSATHGIFEELGRHAKGDGSQECPNCGSCKESAKHVLFDSHVEHVRFDSQKHFFVTDFLIPRDIMFFLLFDSHRQVTQTS